MDVKPKNRAGSVGGVKLKESHQTQQQKLKNTLDRWLVKPQKVTCPEKVSQQQEDVEISEENALQSTSDETNPSQNTEQDAVYNEDEETQLLTPQEPDKNTPILTEDAPQETETSTKTADASVKQKRRITDFFSGSSSQRDSVKRSRIDRSPDESEEEPASPEVQPDVTWLGTPIAELKRTPGCGGGLPRLKDVPDQHTVMIRVRAILCFIYSFQNATALAPHL